MNYFLFEADDLKLNLIFTEEELETFRQHWKKNVSLVEIAESMKRKPSEIALLIIDHAERSLIKKRKKGIFGGH